jgi:hypothetical protein
VIDARPADAKSITSGARRVKRSASRGLEPSSVPGGIRELGAGDYRADEVFAMSATLATTTLRTGSATGNSARL